MVSTDPSVVLLSNDVPPGSALPVAAPGLRQFGLAEGLRAHGLRPEIVVVRHLVDRLWRGPVPAPTIAGTRVLATRRLQSFLEARAPVVVVLTNSNQIDHLAPAAGVSYIFDFFAPKVLELLGQSDGPFDVEKLATLRERKIRALRLADAVIVNGRKKVPYALAWLLQTDRDLRSIPLEIVPMCVPLGSSDASPRSGRPILGIAGYLQRWSAPGAWLDVVEGVLDEADVELQVLLPGHWGTGDFEEGGHTVVDRIVSHGRVRSREMLTYAAYCRFLGGLDVVIDLFDRSLEREYAMVTRTIVALSQGVPVVHPPFTEVAEMIAAYDAGWLVEAEDVDAVRALLLRLAQDPAEISEKQHNAARLATDALAPEVATRPLAALIRELAG